MNDRPIALVTGAATGIGRACAERLAAEGYLITATWRSRETQTQELIAGLPGEGHRAFPADLADAGQIRELAHSLRLDPDRIDVLVNAAGRFTRQNALGEDFAAWTESWEDCLRANLLGPMHLAWHIAPMMKQRGRGTIINITSRGAFRGEPEAPAYGAAKSGLNSASQSLAVKLAPHGIRVFAIAPGWVDTPMAAGRIPEDIAGQIPLGRAGRPEEIADLVHYLVTGQTDYLTGAILDANGASHLRN